MFLRCCCGFFFSDAEESFKFDERYYTMLLNKSLTWDHVDKAPVTGFSPAERWQWDGKDEEGVQVQKISGSVEFPGKLELNLRIFFSFQKSFMLNADVALVLDLHVQPK